MKKIINKWGEPISKSIINNTGWDDMKGGKHEKEYKKEKYLRMKEKYLKLKYSLFKI